MEGGNLAAIEERMVNQSSRISSNHDSIKEMRVEQRATDKALGGLIIELREVRKDVQQTQKLLIWVLTTAGTALVSFLTFLVLELMKG